MRVVHESSDALILKERAITMRAIGAVLAVGGIIMVGTSVRANGLSIAAPLIVGSILATLGALFALLPSTHTFAFSRSERRLIVLRSRLGRTTREEYSLRDIADAYVDESRSSEGGGTWRVVVQLTDGQTVPVTSYYTSGYANKRRAADLIRGFLDRTGSRQSNEPLRAPEPPPARGLTIRQRLGAMAILALFGLVFGGIGGSIVVREHRRLTTWQPVQATVLSTRVDEHSDSDGSTYSPVVVYRYYVHERPYTSSRVLPVSESRSGGWAYSIIAEYEPGAKYTAWYDPADPSAAYLRRSHSIVAPIFVGVGTFLIFMAVLAATRRTWV